MSEWVPVQLSTQSYVSASRPASAQRLVNMYVEAVPDGGKSPMVLLPTAALRLWAQLPDNGPIRGLHVMGSYVYVVSGETLYQVSQAGTITTIGTVSGTQDVYMTDNETHVLICADAHVYAADSTSIVQVTAQRMNGATYQDGYGIVSLDGTEQFYLTGLDDMTTISALDFSTADAFADVLKGCISDHRQLLLFGKKTIEIWDNTGNALFPFQRSPGGFIERGCVASGSIAKTEHRVAWLGDDLAVYMTQGYQPVRISTPPIELLIAGVTDPSAASGFTYSQGGHTYYVLNFATLTVCYDFLTGRWHERQTFDADRWRGHRYARLGTNTHLVGDFEKGRIYELDSEAYVDETDEGDYAVQRIVTSQVIDGEGHRIVMDEVELCIESGVGNVTGDDTNPVVSLECSDDGGRTWSSPRDANVGELGDYSTKVSWNRLGSFKSRIMRFSIRAGVKLASTSCRARVEGMS